MILVISLYCYHYHCLLLLSLLVLLQLLLLSFQPLSYVKSMVTAKNIDSSILSSRIIIHPMRIAYCLTGQLSRLELISKIRNIFVPNAIIGHTVHLFIILDNNTTHVKQTFWRFNYSDNQYNSMSEISLQKYIYNEIDISLQGTEYQSSIKNIRVHNIQMRPSARHIYAVRGNKIPVTDKSGPISDPFASSSVEPAAIRFQNNMRWLSTLRDCVKYMQSYEQQSNRFYDVVVRIRDDTFALGPWLIDPNIYIGRLVSQNMSTHFGINDHNFAIDRRYADDVMRGVTEDYYFNSSLDIYSWVNPERRLFKIASSKNVPMLATPLCEHPLIPLRGSFNGSHWRVHVTYAEQVLGVCYGPEYIQFKSDNNIRIKSIVPAGIIPPNIKPIKSNPSPNSKIFQVNNTRKRQSRNRLNKSGNKGQQNDHFGHSTGFETNTRRLEQKDRNQMMDWLNRHKKSKTSKNKNIIYNKTYLENIIIRNRRLIELAWNGEITQRDTSVCCNERLVDAMRAQAVVMGVVYNYIT